ncbi:GNAT family N-acetyltransferase [Neobacillus sp. NPDC093127]|uniref:GNAT family N-acetyltransferase n=1 Tax=Neobacillus sp. NPDC093127 TaxID=3364296 RepID=UPI00381E4C40
MPKIFLIESLVGKTFKILNGFPAYITIEQKEKPTGLISEQELSMVIDLCSKWGFERIGVSLDKTSEDFDCLSEIFLRNGFEHFSSRVEVYKDLTNLDKGETPFTYATLADQSFSESKFKSLWERCTSGSDNKPTTLTIDQHLMAVKSELGADWEESCHVYYLQHNPIGISIPHLEPGTMDEGRLFYFGLLPEARGQGLSTALHLQSLWALKEMGASYYIGSTHLGNKKMQRVFKKNGCIIRTQTETYYKYFSN